MSVFEFQEEMFTNKVGKEIAMKKKQTRNDLQTLTQYALWYGSRLRYVFFIECLDKCK